MRDLPVVVAAKVVELDKHVVLRRVRAEAHGAVRVLRARVVVSDAPAGGARANPRVHIVERLRRRPRPGLRRYAA